MAGSPELNSMSRQELTELRTQLDKAIAAAGDRDKQKALKAAEAVVREHGFTLADLAPQAGKGRSGRGRGSRSAADSSAAKYRNPDNPDQTWSGRGRRPQWVHDAIANGRTMADLEAS